MCYHHYFHEELKIFMHQLLWITWDPAREIFYLPFIHFPVTWYGLLFALGFSVGYSIFFNLLLKNLILKPQFNHLDEVSFPHLQEFLRDHPNYAKIFFSNMSNADKTEILRAQAIPIKLRESILQNLNRFLKENNFSPDGIESIKNLTFAKKHLSTQKFGLLQNRVFLEQSFPKVFLAIKDRAKSFVEKLSLYFVIGTILGARLGHLLFYENLTFFLKDPLRIVKTWEGGLSSHGAAFGIMAAILLFLFRYRDKYSIAFLTLLDMAVIPVALAGAFIRIGNFINQEILGKVTSLPWGIIFSHPAGGEPPFPRHPAQLYESAWYFIVFLVLWKIFKDRKIVDYQGKVFGLFLILVFMMRFCIEFLKVEQSEILAGKSFLLMGQYLSIPFIALGCILCFKNSRVSHSISASSTDQQ